MGKITQQRKRRLNDNHRVSAEESWNGAAQSEERALASGFFHPTRGMKAVVEGGGREEGEASKGIHLCAWLVTSSKRTVGDVHPSSPEKPTKDRKGETYTQQKGASGSRSQRVQSPDEKLQSDKRREIRRLFLCRKRSPADSSRKTNPPPEKNRCKPREHRVEVFKITPHGELGKSAKSVPGRRMQLELGKHSLYSGGELTNARRRLPLRSRDHRLSRPKG